MFIILADFVDMFADCRAGWRLALIVVCFRLFIPTLQFRLRKAYTSGDEIYATHRRFITFIANGYKMYNAIHKLKRLM
jgi:hypothetical protein